MTTLQIPPSYTDALQQTSILALTGRPGVGKDACAAVLAQSLGYRTIAFADLLRREVAAAWRVDERMLTDRPTKEWAIPALAAGMCAESGFLTWCAEGGESLHTARSPRWALQNWATWRRRFDPDYFARPVGQWILREMRAGWRNFVVTDLRFGNELAMVQAIGARVIRVHRQEVTGLADDTAFHESERSQVQIPADFDIVNDGTLQALASAVLACPLVHMQKCAA